MSRVIVADIAQLVVRREHGAIGRRAHPAALGGSGTGSHRSAMGPLPEPEVLACLPVLPLANVVLLPGMMLPLSLARPAELALVDAARSGGRHIGVPLLRPRPEAADGRPPPFEPVFGVGRLVAHSELPAGRRLIRLEGIGRVRLACELPTSRGFREVVADPLVEEMPDDHEALAVLTAQFERVARCTGDLEPTLRTVLTLADPRERLYALTACLPHLELLVHDEDSAARREDSAAVREGGVTDDFHARAMLLQRSLEATSTDERVRFLCERATEFLRAIRHSSASLAHLN